MKRRVVLLSCATALTGLSGCTSGGDPVAQSPATPDKTQSLTDAEEAFRTNISDAVDGQPSFSFEDEAWSVAYQYDICCGEALRAHQLALAKNVTAVQPNDVTVALSTTHECQTVEWELSSDVSRRYRGGELSEQELATHINESSERTNTC